MRKGFSGENECFVCGETISWEKVPDILPGQIAVYERPDVMADVFAVGRNEDETVKFEVSCICPKCRTKNKFYKDVKVK